MKKFPLCFWNYATFEQIGKDPVKDWVDAGFTMALSPVFRKGIDDPAQMRDLLDKCLQNGISVIIDDKRCKWDGVLDSEEDYRKNFTDMLNEFGRHKAVYGFYVGDEPQGPQAETVKKAVKIQKELCPEKEPFVNFLPYWDESEADTGIEDFDEWIHDIAVESGLGQLSYDCYWQMNADDPSHDGINRYYRSLKKYTDAAKRDSLPLWVTNLAVPHFQYTEPTLDDFRWQLNTTIASGASCVWWFFLYLRLPRVNYRMAPIDEKGNRTKGYENLAMVQNTFQNQFGSLFTHLIHDETYHTLITFGGYPRFEYKTHKYLKNVTSDSRIPGLVSFFHTENGDEYMAFVNNSRTESGMFTFKFTDRVKEIYRVAYTNCGQVMPTGSFIGNDKDAPTSKDVMYPVIKTENGSYEINCRKNDNANCLCEKNGEIQNSAWLAPGQMEVFRVVLK